MSITSFFERPGAAVANSRCDRAHLEVTFPRLTGYRFDVATERLAVSFRDGARLTLSTVDVPDDRRERADRRREEHPHARSSPAVRSRGPFVLARLTLDRCFPEKVWLFLSSWTSQSGGSEELPRVSRRGRYGKLGAEGRARARGDGRGRELREEPGLGQKDFTIPYTMNGEKQDYSLRTSSPASM